MDEKWHKRAADWKLVGEALQPFFLGFGAIGAVLTFVVAEIDMADGREKEAKDRTFEARKPYLAKQLDLYSETISVVGLLMSVSPNAGDDFGNVLRRWTTLYLSELPLVADQPCVATRLSAVDKAVWAYYEAPSKDERKSRRVALKSAACDLAFAMQSAVSKTWDTSQPGSRNAQDAAAKCGPRPSTFVCPISHLKEEE